MADIMITISGDHTSDVDTRLAALGHRVTYDVNIDCWLYNALNLGRYEDDATTEGFVPVPAELLWVALGRAIVALGNGPAGWYATDSAPSDTLLNNIATNAHTKGFAVDDDGGQVEFPTAWHLREQLAKFVRDNVDYAGDDTAFLLADDEDRFNASCASFTAEYLETYEHLKLASLIKKRHMDSWSMLLWLLGWSMEQPEEAATSEFAIVARALLKAADGFAPHIYEASPADAVAAFLLSGERLPSDMLTDDFDLASRLSWISSVKDYAKPALRMSLLEDNFETVLRQHSQVAKWTGTGPDAFIHFSALLTIVLAGVTATGFDIVGRLGSELNRLYDDYWREGSRGDNINFLREMVSTTKSTGGSGGASSLSGGNDTSAARGMRAGASLLTALVAGIDAWRTSDDSADTFAVTDVILQSGYTPSIKWVLGLGSSSALPSVFDDDDIVKVPLEWSEYFIDTIVTGSDGTSDDLLAGLKIGDFAPTFISNLKAGKIAPGHIDWDKDFVCVILRHLRATTTVSPMLAMDTAKVLCDSDRLSHHIGAFASKMLQYFGSTSSQGSCRLWADSCYQLPAEVACQRLVPDGYRLLPTTSSFSSYRLMPATD